MHVSEIRLRNSFADSPLPTQARRHTAIVYGEFQQMRWQQEANAFQGVFWSGNLSKSEGQPELHQQISQIVTSVTRGSLWALALLGHC